jgi:hypothetical protein
LKGGKTFHCPECFEHVTVSLSQPETICSKCRVKSAERQVPASILSSARKPQIKKPPRYREVLPTQLKKVSFRPNLEVTEVAEDPETLGEQGQSALSRAQMAVEDYRSHELRQSRGEVIDGGHFEVNCPYADIEDIVKMGAELIANETQASATTLKIGALRLDLRMMPQSKSSIGRALSLSLQEPSSTRLIWRRVKEAGSKGGYDALTEADLSLIEPMLGEIEQLREGLKEQLDEVRAVKNSYLRRMHSLRDSRKIEESIDLTRRYEMSACTTPRSRSRLNEADGNFRQSTLKAEESTSHKQEELEDELRTLQDKLREADADPRGTSKISTKISRVKTELQFLRTKKVLKRTTNTAVRSLNSSFDDLNRSSSSCLSMQSSAFDDFAKKQPDLDAFDEACSTPLSSDVMKEQLSLRRSRHELEEQRMQMEIDAEAAKRKLEVQVASLATQKEQLEAERRQFQQERSMQLQLSRENLRRRSQLQGVYQSLIAYEVSAQQDSLQDIADQLLSLS